MMELLIMATNKKILGIIINPALTIKQKFNYVIDFADRSPSRDWSEKTPDTIPRTTTQPHTYH